jgi:hypothetical protein
MLDLLVEAQLVVVDLIQDHLALAVQVLHLVVMLLLLRSISSAWCSPSLLPWSLPAWLKAKRFRTFASPYRAVLGCFSMNELTIGIPEPVGVA